MVLLALAALGLAAPQCENEFKLAPLGTASCSFLGNATSYLPDPRVYAAYRARAPLWRDIVEEADQKIARLQFPPSCTDGETMWHLHRLASHGFGANLLGFARLAGIHWDAGKSVTITNAPDRFNPTGECGPGWSCWLSPLTNCSLQAVPLQRVTWWDGGLGDVDMTRECRPHGRFEVESGTCICESGWVAADRGCRRRADMDDGVFRIAIEHPSDQAPAEQSFGDVPGHGRYSETERASRARYGLMWWLGHRAWYLLKGAPKRPELDAFVRRVGLTSGSCLAIHVRRGDSCHDAKNPQKTCPPISAYVDRALHMQQTYGPYDHVYVSSDDDPNSFGRAIYQIGQSLDGVVYQPIDRRVFHPIMEIGVDDNRALESAQQVQDFMNDVWAMGSCHAFVGTFTSSISQLAYTLQVMRNGHYVPFASLDVAFENKWFMDDMGLRTASHAH